MKQYYHPANPEGFDSEHNVSREQSSDQLQSLFEGRDMPSSTTSLLRYAHLQDMGAWQERRAAVLQMQRLYGNRTTVQLLKNSASDNVTKRDLSESGFDAAQGHGSPVRVAKGGIQGSGEKLPYLAPLQNLFGPYCLTGVRAHRSESAKIANKSLNSLAYAIGEDVAFREDWPSLGTVAHEATHVLDQRSGLKLPDEMGQQGDEHEQFANEVARRVERNQSVVSLLDAHFGARWPGHAAAPLSGKVVQRLEVKDLDGNVQQIDDKNAATLNEWLVLIEISEKKIGKIGQKIEKLNIKLNKYKNKNQNIDNLPNQAPQDAANINMNAVDDNAQLPNPKEEKIADNDKLIDLEEEIKILEHQLAKHEEFITAKIKIKKALLDATRKDVEEATVVVNEGSSSWQKKVAEGRQIRLDSALRLIKNAQSEHRAFLEESENKKDEKIDANDSGFKSEFLHITKDNYLNFLASLEETVNNPVRIRNRKGHCGASVIASIIAHHYPDSFANVELNMIRTARAQLGKLAMETVRFGLWANFQRHNIDEVTWVFTAPWLTGVRKRKEQDPDISALGSGGNKPSEVKEWFELIGVTDITVREHLNKIEPDEFADIIKLLNDYFYKGGYEIYLHIYSAYIKGNNDNIVFFDMGKEKKGAHGLRLASPFAMTDSWVVFRVWTWGKDKLLKVHKRALPQLIRGYTCGKMPEQLSNEESKNAP